MNPSLSLLMGVACAAAGGELFVRGLVSLASRARVSATLIGTSIAAFATSSPELSVAIGAAASGRPEISLGDALGSNVVNVALILAIALCIAPISTPRSSLRRDFPMVLVVPLAIGILGLDGQLSRVDGMVLLSLFIFWLALLIHAAQQDRRNSENDIICRLSYWRIMGVLAAGLTCLIGSGHFIVSGAREIALRLGLPEFVIGATIVAVGTSIPELATTVISRLRGHGDIGLGTVLGSNVFNGLFIVGLAAVICPIRFKLNEVGWALGFGLVTPLLSLPRRDGLIPRWRGLLLLVIYATFIGLILQS